MVFTITTCFSGKKACLGKYHRLSQEPLDQTVLFVLILIPFSMLIPNMNTLSCNANAVTVIGLITTGHKYLAVQFFFLHISVCLCIKIHWFYRTLTFKKYFAVHCFTLNNLLLIEIVIMMRWCVCDHNKVIQVWYIIYQCKKQFLTKRYFERFLLECVYESY